MEKKIGILWFRNDLRLEDNEALIEAAAACDEILPLFIFDEHLFESQSSFGFPKLSDKRRHFILDCVSDLRSQLSSIYQNDLIVRYGHSKDVIFELAHQIKSKWVFCNRERTREEVDIQDQVEECLWSIGQELRFSRGKMLLYTADLPFPITQTPDRFSVFRKEVAYILVRQPLLLPESLPPFSMAIENTLLIDQKKEDIGTDSIPRISGGSTAALSYMRNRLESIYGLRQASQISAWISSGCISPKMVYYLCQAQLLKKDERSFDELVRRLLRRDHHRLMGKKYGDHIFFPSGIRQQKIDDEYDDKLIQNWCEGRTNQPLVNACMMALKSTGYLRHKFRLFVGIYFIYHLKQPWLAGAEYFESQLLDYDPCSNYGNWMRIAGIGPSQKEFSQLNLMNQEKILDPEGEFVARWS